MTTTINRKNVKFISDSKRVIARFFFPGPESRVISIIQRVIDMPDQAAQLVLNQTFRDFSARHRNISKIFEKHFRRAKDIMNNRIDGMDNMPDFKKLLIGSFLTSEYSIESAAFFNPSMVEHPDQTGLQEGEKRVIISFRATGEGHISSIVFRGGVLDKNNNLELTPTGSLVDEAEAVRNYVYHKSKFCKKLKEMHINEAIVKAVNLKLNEEFDYNELNHAVEQTRHEFGSDFSHEKMLSSITWLADSHYNISFSLDTSISERVIFPIAAAESNGIEDARFVKFTDDDGTFRYYATYTAYNGYTIMPKLIETKDFYNFNFMPIHGENAQNKGMALFPRKVNGKFAMLARLDGVNNYIMMSDAINIWDKAIKIQEPKFPWEFIQIGNCGSPIETKHGWLVITHGVGTMRKYCIGATLLDLNDPTKIIGQLSEPLLCPNEEEREGYVPNVVYSCGSIVNNNQLIMPYAMSDTASTYACVPMTELLNRLLPSNADQLNSENKPKAQILVVDDSTVIQNLLSKFLKASGYGVTVAPDGIIALMEIVKGNFDLILSDINMPNLDGYQLLEYIQQNNIDIPLILMSSMPRETNEFKGLKKGALEYIKKPFDPDMLLLKIERILEQLKEIKE